MKKSLLAHEGDNWQVWTQWYEDRLYGRSFIPKLEVERLLIDEKIWEQGARAVNAEIQRIIDKYAPKQDPLGNRWVVAEAVNRLVIDPRGNAADREAAAEPATRQLHERIKQKAEKFVVTAARIEKVCGWSDIVTAAKDFFDTVSCPTAEIPDVIAIVYDTSLTLATFLEYNKDLQDPNSYLTNVQPMNPDMKRELSSLVQSTAPWIRRFPTAMGLDDMEGGGYSAKYRN
jgi:hypothetical protein